MTEADAPIPTQPDDELVPLEPDEADVEHLQFKLAKNLTRRIDQYLVDRIPHLSRNGVQKLIENGLVKVNGRIVKASYKPRDNDVVDIVAPPKPISELIPEEIPLDIVYEDEHFLALNKQPNLMVHPARGVWTGTLVNGLVHYARDWSMVNGNWRPGILHRLDRNTTGIMLVAKSDEAHWRIAGQFENRTIQKTYVAVCHGVPRQASGMIDLPIGRDRYIREKQAVRKEENGGKPAVTRYDVLETFEAEGIHVQHAGGEVRSDIPKDQFRLIDSPFEKDKKLPPPPGKFSFIKLSPKTGRTHQLRVHMAALGFPMVGDTMYGGRIFEVTGGAASAALKPDEKFRFDRQALHAFEITFTHPGTHQQITLSAPVAPDMSRLLEILRAGKF
ncbi:MAG TPA: RluA family pseudouridine synthase [Tepidisphaeraceae bacterium]|nr:RluA family pseudouridine synthase [Tepidisphaeraceae bacterium]